MSREEETKMEWQRWSKQLAESALQASNRFLFLANRQMAMNPLLEEFTAELKKLTGCAAVGIRILDELGNIPYKAYEGFEQRFYELESPLSLHTHQCMCINVIKGTADPKFPFYTEGGSFYMNGTTRFLATVSEEAKGATRNACNQHGYESVALVPIRGGDRILGLIHLADTQENRVPLNLVETVEGVAMQLGTAIQRVMMEEALRKKTYDLGERVKELNCLFAFSNLMETPDISLPEIFQGLVNIIPPGWQYPEKTCARLVLEDQIFKTANFMETIWRQSSPILMDGRRVGTLEVYYLEEKPECDEGPFLEEERNLLNVLAGRIGKHIQRKRVEEVLRESEARFRSYFELPLIGIAITSPEKGWIEVNDKICSMMGYSRDELLRTTWAELTHPEDLVADVEQFNQVLAGHIDSYSMDKRFFRKNGEVLWASIAVGCVRDSGGMVKYIVALGLDITERKRVEKVLQESEARYRELAESISDVFFAMDRDLRYTYWNKASEKLTGIAAKDAIGKSLSELFPDEAGARAARFYLEVLRTQQPRNFVNDYRFDGKDFFFEISAYPSSAGLSVFVKDITEHKRMEEELRISRDKLEMRVQERTKELEAVNEALRAENEERLRAEIELRESENRLRELSTALLSTQERERKLIAQEIHDSMGSSLAASKFKVESIIKKMGDDNPRIKVALDSVIPILQVTIEEARRIQMSLRPSMLDDLGILATLNWLCRQFESTYSAIRIKREIDIQEDEMPESLKIVIYRVLQETLNNIAKHSKASVVLLSLRKAKQKVELVIRDNGQGFDLEEAYSRKGTSRGLGLYSMRERIELSGGYFSIESSKAAGTVIRATWLLNS
jgi:PAS domain S-box-containing protein